MIETVSIIWILLIAALVICKALGKAGKCLTSPSEPYIPENHDLICLRYNDSIKHLNFGNEIVKSGTINGSYFAEICNKKLYKCEKLEAASLRILIDKSTPSSLNGKPNRRNLACSVFELLKN